MTDFGHMHIDNVKGSDINQNDMGHDGDTTSGNSSYGDSDDINQGDWFMHSNYLKTDGFTGPNGTGDDFVAGGRGMFGDYAIHMPKFVDTTTMDNLGRFHGLKETMPTGCHGVNIVGNHSSNLSCYHSATQYGNNDTDNNDYWSTPGGTGIYSHQNYAGGDGINRHGDNGWQRSLNGYTTGDFGAGAICNVGDTCNVSNTFSGTGYGECRRRRECGGNRAGQAPFPLPHLYVPFHRVREHEGPSEVCPCPDSTVCTRMPDQPNRHAQQHRQRCLQ